ncbi:MAG TPA: TIGR03619 family F420-dependent LLM class oxidoreductase [Acidimicrobiales bacterium]|jgi:probable F420-dependent oxidoreductase|nr:TIGR03619 family F420-dependent LLM class oxidoreductase [Acidimicrobiales bacterium]
MTIEFGIQLPIQAQSTVFVEEWEATASAAELAAVAQSCDRAGFAYVAVCDHVAIPRSRADAMSTTWYDTIATLGWLAGITEHVRLLSHVYVAAYRHPLQTAKAFATLDALSNGRAILGVGAGHVEEEFDVLGVSFHERGRLLDESIDAVRRALRDEWAAGDLGQRPRPVQDGGVPIWVGGSSPAAIKRAALRGDGWLPQGPPADGMPAAIERISRLRADAGRTGPFTVGAFAMPGPPEKVAGALGKLEAMGVDQVQVRFPSTSCADLCSKIEQFGDLARK